MEHKTDSLLTTKKELIFNKPIELNTFILINEINDDKLIDTLILNVKKKNKRI